MLDHGKVLKIFLGDSPTRRGARCSDVCPSTLSKNEVTGWMAVRFPAAPQSSGGSPGANIQR